MVKTVSTAVFSQFSQLASAIMDFFKIEFESKRKVDIYFTCQISCSESYYPPRN